MRLWRGLGVSARTLFSNRLRAVLALASIAVSVGAVVVVGAIGAGASREILRQTAALGVNLLVVRPAQAKISAGRKQIQGVVRTLTEDDYEAIRASHLVRRAVPGFESTLTAKFGNRSIATRVLGTTEPFLDVCRFSVARGRFFDEDDDRRSLRVAVLGARVEQELFPADDAVGRVVEIRGLPFKVIGVLKAKGIQADGSDQDNQIVIPIRTALRRVFNQTWLNPIFVSVRSPEETAAAQANIAALLRGRHRVESGRTPDDFAIQDKTKALAVQRELAGSLTKLAVGLAGTSLMVGGIGILALMLMSVKERTGEIGLRMAVGARPRDILTQFLLEACMLSMGGWLAGVLLGIGGAATAGRFAHWPIAITPQALLASLAMMLVAAVGFGSFPARKASLIPPIRALQVE